MFSTHSLLNNPLTGSVTVEIVKGKSMPNLDVGSLSDCYVKAKWLPHKDGNSFEHFASQHHDELVMLSSF